MRRSSGPAGSDNCSPLAKMTQIINDRTMPMGIVIHSGPLPNAARRCSKKQSCRNGKAGYMQKQHLGGKTAYDPDNRLDLLFLPFGKITTHRLECSPDRQNEETIRQSCREKLTDRFASRCRHRRWPYCRRSSAAMIAITAAMTSAARSGRRASELGVSCVILRGQYLSGWLRLLRYPLPAVP